MTKLEIEIRADLHARLLNEALRSHRPIDAVVEQALREYLGFLSEREQSVQPAAEATGEEPPRKPREFGSGKGTFIIHPDFDEPLEDFKDYR